VSIATVLVVEDYDAARKALCFIVSSYGPTAIGAADGERALVQAAARRPDLIFCDIRMPGMDGIEFLKRLRVIPGLLDVPVIAMSGLGTDAELARIHAAGFAGHLMKPVTPSVIGNLLERLDPGISTR
jgi:two-component system CheB/CheR fusion protein